MNIDFLEKMGGKLLVIEDTQNHGFLLLAEPEAASL
jgi:hypothetical protein